MFWPGNKIGVNFAFEFSVIVSVYADEDPYDFLSRFFAPWTGVDEDPVCGSAHCTLAGYWVRQLNRTSLFARQCSSRGGEIYLEVDELGRRVIIKGTTTLVSIGKLLL